MSDTERLDRDTGELVEMDAAPLMTMGRFQIGRLGLTTHGTPTLAEWTEAGHALVRVRSAGNWAIGDWLLIADARGWNDDDVQAVLSTQNLKRGTLANLKSVAKAFPPGTRLETLPWSHHAIVQSLGNEDATRLLEQAQAERWGYDEIRAHSRATRQAQARLVQAWPEGTFGVLVARPPWHVAFGEPQDHPAPMTMDAIAALAPRVQAIMAPDCICYLAAQDHALDDALTVLRAWGLRFVGSMTHISDTSIMTDWSRRRHTTVLIGVRGTPATAEESMRPDSVFRSWNDLYDAALLSFPAAPKVDLFADGDARAGWTAWSMAPAAAPERALVVSGDAVGV